MTYKLYGMEPTQENIQRASRSYYRGTPRYLLVYTKGRKPTGAIPVKLEQLSEEDAIWLGRCNMEIIRKTVNDSLDIQKSITAFLERLEDELEKEKTRLEASAVGS